MKHFISMLTLTAFLSATTAHAKNPKDLPTPIVSSVPMELRIIQQEIYVEVPNNGAGAAIVIGGVLGVLAGAAINKATVAGAEKRVADIRNQLIDYNFQQRFDAAFREKANLTSLHQNQEIKLFHTTYAADANDKTASIGKNVLVIQPSYLINNKFDQVSVRIAVWLMDREIKSNGKIKTTVTNMRNFKYVVLLDSNEKANKTETAKAVAELGTEQLVMMIDRSIDGAIELFNLSMTADVKAKLAKGGKVRLYEVLGEQVRGTIIAKTSASHDVFFQRGSPQSINGFNNFMSFSRSTEHGINAVGSAP